MPLVHRQEIKHRPAHQTWEDPQLERTTKPLFDIIIKSYTDTAICVATAEVNKDGQHIAASSNCTKLKLKYPGHQCYHLMEVTLFRAGVFALMMRQWSRRAEFRLIHLPYQLGGELSCLSRRVTLPLPNQIKTKLIR